MTSIAESSDARSLRRQAEAALQRERPSDELMPLLHRLASTASEGSEDSRFAHRHLARLLLESSPWTAALHLRSVLRVAPDDDGAHAMLGFCHAVQGNFRCAVAAYRRAGALAP